MKVSYAPLYKVIKVESVMASLWELGPVIFGPTEDFVSWLQNKGLLASSRTCSSCSGAVMRLGRRGDVSDGCVWRCPQCKTTKSIREGSFFTKSRMPLKKWLLLLHCWVRQYPAKDAAEEAEVDPNTACDIYRYFFWRFVLKRPSYCVMYTGGLERCAPQHFSTRLKVLAS